MSQIIYGIHPVQEALKSSHVQIEKILIGTRTPNPPLQSILHLANKKKIPVTFTTKESLGGMTKGGVHQNVVGLVKETPYVDLAEIFSVWKKEDAKSLLLILDGIQDPQNFGSLIRTGLGCGVHGIIIPKDRSVGITPGGDQGVCWSGCAFADCQSREYCRNHRTLKKKESGSMALQGRLRI